MTADFDPWAGHLGRLSSQQAQALTELKEAAATTGLYRYPSPAAQGKPAVLPSHDDTTLLRFLRARGFNPAKAHEQLASSYEWRAAQNLSKMYETISPEDMTAARRFYPRWTGRRDKLGCPVYVYSLHYLAPDLVKELNSVPHERRERDITALAENVNLVTLRLCSALPSASFPTPICCGAHIIDLDKVSLSLMWSMRAHLQESSRIANINFPETISRLFVVNSPWFFATVWSWVKGFFDEGTQQKLFILGSDPAPELLKHIDASDLPKSFGGDLDWVFLDEPNLDNAAKEALQSDTFVDGPFVFVAEAVGKGTLVRWTQEDRERLQVQNEHLTA